jgi:hypothetical protein
MDVIAANSLTSVDVHSDDVGCLSDISLVVALVH